MLQRVRFPVRLAKVVKTLINFENISKRRLCHVASIMQNRPNTILKNRVAMLNSMILKSMGGLKNDNYILWRTFYMVSSRNSVLVLQEGQKVVTKSDDRIQNPVVIIRTMAKKASKSKNKAKKPRVDTAMAEGIVDIASMDDKMDSVLENMNHDFASKIPGRITVGFMDNVMVKTGSGKKVPLYQIALVKAKSDNFTIEIQEGFPNAGKAISTAIAETGFNLIPQVRGDTVIVPIPMFSQDQRINIGKIAKTISDHAKVELRKVRQKAMSDIRRHKEGKSKDLIRRIETTVQQLTDYYTERIDSALQAKLNDIMDGKLK